MPICSSSENSRTKCFFGISFSVLPFYMTYSCLDQEFLWIITHQLLLVLFSPVLFANLINLNLLGLNSPTGWEYLILQLQDCTIIGHLKKLWLVCLLGMCNLIGGADKILFAGESLLQGCLSSHMEVQERFVWMFMCSDSGQNGHLFSSGNSSFPIAVLLAGFDPPIPCDDGALQTQENKWRMDRIWLS